MAAAEYTPLLAIIFAHAFNYIWILNGGRNIGKIRRLVGSSSTIAISALFFLAIDFDSANSDINIIALTLLTLSIIYTTIQLGEILKRE